MENRRDYLTAPTIIGIATVLGIASIWVVGLAWFRSVTLGLVVGAFLVWRVIAKRREG